MSSASKRLKTFEVRNSMSSVILFLAGVWLYFRKRLEKFERTH